MTADPRGRWFRVYARQVRQHPKFRDLNVTHLGAWLTLRSEAELRDGAVFTDVSEAALMLRRRGCPRPKAMVLALVELHLFDVLEDGTVTVHDRADHDRPTFPSDDPERVKERVQKHRDRKRYESGNDEETTRYSQSNDSPRAHAHSGAEAVSVSDSQSANGNARANDDAFSDSVVAYHALTGKYPKQGVVDWLNRLGDDHPEEAIVRFMGEEYVKDGNVATLIGRTEAALKLDAHRREKRDKQAQAEYLRQLEAPQRQREREATPEQRERASLQQQAIRLGLQKGIPVPTDPAEVRKFVMKHGAAQEGAA